MEELQIDDDAGNSAAGDDAGDVVEVDPDAEEEGLDARENAGDVANEIQQDAQMQEERHLTSRCRMSTRILESTVPMATKHVDVSRKKFATLSRPFAILTTS